MLIRPSKVAAVTISLPPVYLFPLYPLFATTLVRFARFRTPPPPLCPSGSATTVMVTLSPVVRSVVSVMDAVLFSPGARPGRVTLYRAPETLKTTGNGPAAPDPLFRTIALMAFGSFAKSSFPFVERDVMTRSGSGVSPHSTTRKAWLAAMRGVEPAVLRIPASFPDASSKLFTSRVSTATCVPVEGP